VASHPAKAVLLRVLARLLRSDAALARAAAAASPEYASRVLRLLGDRSAPELVLHGPRGRERVALTFDDGPAELTPAVLDVLGRHGARATFFVTGENVATREGVLLRTASEGHEVGNHTWNHRPPGNALRDLAQLACTNTVVRQATGVRPRVFRAPFGELTRGLGRAVGAAGLMPVGWDVDPLDWSGAGAEEIASRVLGQTRAGSIVLLHDGCAPDGPAFLAALERMLSGLRDRGFELVTVSELLER
jgi:peptidoglycan/xylan/chitin deacetylase (PgdA/CDA1 family)